jgi:DNA-binding MarR family transcriptional regulator
MKSAVKQKLKVSPPEHNALKLQDVIREDRLSTAYIVRDLHRLFNVALRPALKDTGITTANWYYMRVLWKTEGISQQELAELVGVSSQTVVAATDIMEKNGLVRRGADPDDRRKFKIWLTPKGKALQNQMMPHAMDLLIRSAEGISKKDIACFFDVALRIRRNLLRETGGQMEE